MDSYRKTLWAVFGIISLVAIVLAALADNESRQKRSRTYAGTISSVLADCEWHWSVDGGDVTAYDNTATVTCRGRECVVRAECR